MAGLQRKVSSKAALTRSLVWMLASVVFLDVATAKILDLRAAGRGVSGWRYVQAVFWLAVLVFWGWSGWRDWRAYRAERKVV